MKTKSRERLAAEAAIIKDPALPDRYFMETYKLSKASIANIRKDLRARGVIPGSRRTSGGVEAILTDPRMTAETVLPQESAPLPPITSTELATLGLDTELTDENDEATRKMLLSRCRSIALDPDTHPDTVLTASQVYIKLKDAVRAKSLGPGKPVTHEDAVARLGRLMSAVGPEIVSEAITSAFGGPNATKSSGPAQPADSPDTSPEAVTASSTPGSEAGTTLDAGPRGLSDVGRAISTDEHPN